MKRLLTTISACFLWAFLCCIPTAAANRVPEMEIEVALRSDGSAYVTQTWSAETHEGTEFYLVCRDSGYLTITDFSVADQNGPYAFVEDWDINASFEEKAGKCGILETNEGVELCWGITQYGQQRYAVEYILHDLVGAYSDTDGFHHRFVDEMGTFPTDVVVTICNQDGSPLADEFCDIWAFGFDGQIQFEDGVIRTWTESPLEDGQHMTVMVSLEQGHLSPLRAVEDSFETVKERAFEDSDYEEPTFLETVVGFFLLCIIGLVWMIVIPMLIDGILKARLKRRMKRVDYVREAPNGGNLNATYQLGLGVDLCKEETLLGAYLLRLISQGCLEPTQPGIKSDDVSLRLVHPPRDDDPYDDTLYTILEAAAAADGVLDPKELERYCQLNPTPLVSFMDSCIRNGREALSRSGCYKGADRNGLSALTKKGSEELDELLGFKRFLLDFSLIHQRGVRETVIWQDYMVYALLLGIADQVADQIKKLYPDQLPQVERYETYLYHTHRYHHLMYRPYADARQKLEAQRSSGSGGRSSRGGGRGSSGGGRGGSR